jgi:predicted amidophosphoribosyltransferase
MARKPKPQSPKVEDRAGGILVVNRWLKALAAVLGTEAACVILSEGNLARIIARHDIPHAFLASAQTLTEAPYARDETVVVRDASGRPELHAFLAAIALSTTGFFYRQPLSITDGRVISVLCFGRAPRPDLGDRDLRIAGEIVGSIQDEIERYYPSSASNIAASMELAFSDVEQWLVNTDLPAMMLDSGLVIRAVNQNMRDLLTVDWDGIIGRAVQELDFPGRGGIEFLFRHAVDSGVSTPRMDIAFEESAVIDKSLSLRLVASPLSLVDGGSVLIATVDPSRVSAAPPQSLPVDERREQRPTAEFLLETLVRRRALRNRKDVSYVTLRSWRQSIRDHQISALRAIKRNQPAAIAAEVAAEIHDDIRSLFGIANFQAVVPMPCGHSEPGCCLSEEIAKALARDLGLPVAHALSLAPEKGSSHPARNAVRPGMTLATPVTGAVLLIDDVSTSGRHIEEASLLLRSKGASVLAIAWIGGDATE